MSLVGWLAVGVSAAGYVGCWRSIFRRMADNMVSDWFDLCVTAFFVSFFCLGWPLFALYVGFDRTIGQRDAEAFAKRLGGLSREERQSSRDLRRRERAIEIARQEQELGIGAHQ